MKANDDDGILLLCRCLASVSVADGDLDAREIATMVSAVEQVTGSQVSADKLVGITIEMEDDPEDFWQEMHCNLAEVDAGFKMMILKTCIMVARADDKMEDAERLQIFFIGRLLEFTDQEIEREFEVVQ